MKIKIDTGALGIAWTQGTQYRIEIEPNTLLDEDLVGNALISNAHTFTTNATGPSIFDTDPIAGGLGVIKDNELEIQFNRLPVTLSGTIRLYKVGTPDELIYTFNAREYDTHDDKIYLNYFGLLEAGQSYYVLIDDTLFADSDTFPFAGITDSATLQFATSADSFPVDSRNFITNIRGEGSYLLNQSTIIGNTPQLLGQSSTSVTVKVKVLTNSNLVDSIDSNYDDYELFQTFINPDPDNNSSGNVAKEQFGARHVMSADNLTLIVSASGDFDFVGDTTSGEVYVYRRATVNDQFTISDTITCPAGLSLFGRELYLSDNAETLLIGSAMNLRIYRKSGTTYNFSQTIVTASDSGDANYPFQGEQMAVSGNGQMIAVTSYNANGSSNTSDGKINLYYWNGTTFVFYTTLENPIVSTKAQISEIYLSYDGNSVLAKLTDYTTSNVRISSDVYKWTITNFNPSVIVRTKFSNPENKTISFNGVWTTIGNNVYKNSSLHTVLDTSSNTFLTSTFGKIIGSQFLWDYDSSNDSWVKSPYYSRLNVSVPIGNSISPDGTFVLELANQNAAPGDFRIYRYVTGQSYPWNNTTKTLTIETNQINCNTVLSSLVLNVNSVPNTYDGEIKLRYEFTGSDLTFGLGAYTLYRYQRAYEGIRFRIEPAIMSTTSIMDVEATVIKKLVNLTLDTETILTAAPVTVWQFATIPAPGNVYNANTAACSENYISYISDSSYFIIKDISTQSTVATINVNSNSVDNVVMNNSITVIADTGATVEGKTTAGALSVYNTANGSLIRTITSPTPANSGNLGYALDVNENNQIVAISDQGQGWVYNSDGSVMFALSEVSISSAQVGINSNYVAHTVASGVVRIYNLSNGTLFRTITPSSMHTINLSCLDISETHISVCEFNPTTYTHRARIIDISSGATIYTQTLVSGTTALQFRLNDEIFVYPYSSGSTYYIEVRSLNGTLIRQINKSQIATVSGTTLYITDLSQRSITLWEDVQQNSYPTLTDNIRVAAI